jgi:hypothetical protein
MRRRGLGQLQTPSTHEDLRPQSEMELQGAPVLFG